MGETGRLQTLHIATKPPVFRDIQLFVQDMPARTVLGEVIHVNCRVANAGDRPLKLLLLIDSAKCSALVPVGPSSFVCLGFHAYSVLLV